MGKMGEGESVEAMGTAKRWAVAGYGMARLGVRWFWFVTLIIGAGYAMYYAGSRGEEGSYAIFALVIGLFLGGFMRAVVKL